MAEDLSFSTRIRMTLTKMTMLIWKRNMHSGLNGKIRYTLVKRHSVLSQGNEKFKNPVSSQDKGDYYWTRDKVNHNVSLQTRTFTPLMGQMCLRQESKYRKKILCSGLVDYVENQCVYHIYHSNISGKKCTLNVYRTLLHLIMQNVKNSGRLLAQSCSVHQEIGSARSWIRSSL